MGDRLIVADNLWEETAAAAKITRADRIMSVNPEGLVCAHPLADADKYWSYGVPLLAADHVTDETGTGFVHTAPGHGAEDYVAWMAHPEWHDRNMPVPQTVETIVISGLDDVVATQAMAGAWPPGAFLSAFLALEGTGHLPQHTAMVRRHRPADAGWPLLA